MFLIVILAAALGGVIVWSRRLPGPRPQVSPRPPVPSTAVSNTPPPTPRPTPPPTATPTPEPAAPLRLGTDEQEREQILADVLDLAPRGSWTIPAAMRLSSMTTVFLAHPGLAEPVMAVAPSLSEELAGRMAQVYRSGEPGDVDPLLLFGYEQTTLIDAGTLSAREGPVARLRYRWIRPEGTRGEGESLLLRCPETGQLVLVGAEGTGSGYDPAPLRDLATRVGLCPEDRTP